MDEKRIEHSEKKKTLPGPPVEKSKSTKVNSKESEKGNAMLQVVGHQKEQKLIHIVNEASLDFCFGM